MVIAATRCHDLHYQLLLVAEVAEPLIQRLEPSRRVAVLMALLGIVIVGLFIVTVALLGGNWARRLARHTPERKPFDHQHTTRAVRESPCDPPSQEISGDTVQIHRNDGQTKIDR